MSEPAQNNSPKTPLSSLAAGDRAVVVEVRVPSAHRARLMEMGLIPGTSVELVRFAPLGDPVEIKIRGYHLSLRRSDADQVWVRTSGKASE